MPHTHANRYGSVTLRPQLTAMIVQKWTANRMSKAVPRGFSLLGSLARCHFMIASAIVPAAARRHCHCVPPVVLLDIHITLDQVSVSACGLYVDISWNDPETPRPCRARSRFAVARFRRCSGDDLK
jgi:hypothetical protein